MVLRIRPRSTPGTETLDGYRTNAACDIGERCPRKLQPRKNVIVGRQPVARICNLKAIEQARRENVRVLDGCVLKAGLTTVRMSRRTSSKGKFLPLPATRFPKTVRPAKSPPEV